MKRYKSEERRENHVKSFPLFFSPTFASYLHLSTKESHHFFSYDYS